MKWPLTKLRYPTYARNADRTRNAGGKMQYQVELHVRTGEKKTTQTFYVLSLGDKNNVILGFPWLNKHNPTINWAEGTVELRAISIPRHDSPEVIKQ